MDETPEPMEYVVGFLFDEKKEKVLLIEKQSPAWQFGKLNGVGGKIEPNENCQAAMNREFLEETGVEMIQWTRFFTIEDQGRTWKLFCFWKIGTLEDLKAARAVTIERPKIVETAKLPRNVLPKLHWLIPMAMQGAIRQGSGLDWSPVG